MEGDELYPRVKKNVAPDASQGWTRVLMDRAPRLLGDRQCGRKDRKMFKKAMSLLCQVIEHTGDLTLLTDGERRYGVSCLSCVAKPYALASEDDQRRRCPKASKCGSRTKDHKGISEVPNGRHIKRRIQNILTPHSPWPLQRVTPIIWKPSIRRCDAGVRPIGGKPICMPRTQDASRNAWTSTGLGIILCGCILRHGKSRQWLEGFWTMASRSMSSS